MLLSESDKIKLLQLARECLVCRFSTGQEIEVKENDLSNPLRAVGASFVTLTKRGALRGCIGKIAPVEPLYLDVIHNALAAALADIRFSPLTRAELGKILIEISVLSEPKILVYRDTADLIARLETARPGVIVRQGLRQATFLPQVWDKIRTADRFLSELCQKAGLSATAWQQGAEIQIYEVINFQEEK